MKATLEIWENKAAYEEVLGNTTSKGVRVAKVFEANRPFDKGDLARDMRWREEAKTTREMSNAIKRAYARILKVSVKSIVVSFSKYCGCSSCPCSPGWDIYLEEGIFSTSKHTPVCSSVSFEVEK